MRNDLPDGVCKYCYKPHSFTSPRGGETLCEECWAKERERKRVSRSGEKAKEYYREYDRNKRKSRRDSGLCAVCGAPSTKYNCLSCRERAKKYKRDTTIGTQSRENRKRKVFEIYGGVCEICGNDDHRILQLHHKNFNGAQDRKESGGLAGAAQLHGKIIKHGKRDDLQLVCPNCHVLIHWKASRGWYNPDNRGMS